MSRSIISIFRMSDVVPKKYLNKYGGVYTTRIGQGSKKKPEKPTLAVQKPLITNGRPRVEPNPVKTSAEHQKRIYDQLFAPEPIMPGRGIHLSN